MPKSKSTRILSIFLSIIMLVGIVPPSAFASEQDDFTYSYDSHEPEYDYADYESEYDLADGELEYDYDDYKTEYPLADHTPEHTVIVRADSDRTLANDTAIVMDDPVIILDGFFFIPIESIAEFWDANVTFDDTTLTIELDNRRVTLEINSWLMQFWIDGERQTDIDLRNVLDENLTEQPLQRIDGIMYIALDGVVAALGFFVRWVSLESGYFAVVTANEIYQWEARTLAASAQARLTVPDITDNDDYIADEPNENKLFAPLSQPEPHRFTLLAGSNRAFLNGYRLLMTQAAVIRDGTNTFFVPVNNIAALTGADVTFTGNVLSVELGNRRVEMTVGEDSMRLWIDDVRQSDINFSEVRNPPNPNTAQPLQMIGGVYQAPLRVMMMEGFGWYVYWVPQTAPPPTRHFAVVSNTPIDADALFPEEGEPFDDDYEPPQSISVYPQNTTLTIDHGLTPTHPTQQLTATVLPTDAANRTATWTSSDTDVATVSPTGLVTAQGYGTAIITARTAINGLTATSTIRVHERARSITLTPPAVTLYIDGANHPTQALTATIEPGHANNSDIHWSSTNSNVASVNQSGVVQAVNPGTTTIRAELSDCNLSLFAETIITVRRRPADIFLSRETLTLHMTGDVGETYTYLTATVFPTDAYNQNVDWTSNNAAVATVDANGNITAISTGDAIITATVRGTNISRSVLVNVVNLATGIELNYTYTTLVISGGQFGQRQLIASVIPSDAVNQDIIWSSTNRHVADVDGNGNVIAANAGTTTIIAQIDGTNLYATCEVYVWVESSGVTLNYTSYTLVLNNLDRDSVSLVATIDDGTTGTIQWTSDNPSVATVDGQGNVQAQDLGTTFIHATVSPGGMIATARITVVDEVRGISLPETILLEINGEVRDTQTLEVGFDPDTVSDRGVTWESSNPNIVSVNMHGEITAINPGFARITAVSMDGGHEASALVTVISRVTHVLVNEAEMHLVIDGNRIDSAQLHWTVLPSNATNNRVAFEGYDEDVVEVSPLGLVTAVDSGRTEIIIRAVDNGIYSETRVTVTVRVVGLDIVSPSRNLTPANTAVTDTYQLEIRIEPDNATAQDVDWRSGDEGVATVDANGLVRGIRPGSAVITASLDGRVAHVTVTVEPELIIKRYFNGVFANGMVSYHDASGAVLAGNHMMMSLRVFETLGGRFSWQADQTARVALGNIVMNFRAGRNTMYWQYVDDTTRHFSVNLPVAPRFVAEYPDRLFVPVGAVFQALGWHVHWRSAGVNNEQYVLLTRIEDLTDAEILAKINQWPIPDVIVLKEGSLDGFDRGLANRQIVPYNGAVVAKIRNGMTFAAIGPVIESLPGGSVSWDAGNQMVTITYDGVTIQFAIGATHFTVIRGGQTATRLLATAGTVGDGRSFAENGRTYVPIGNIFAKLGFYTYFVSPFRNIQGETYIVLSRDALPETGQRNAVAARARSLWGLADATHVTVDRANVTLRPGNSQQIAATVHPRNAASWWVGWSSSNPAVAIVDAAGMIRTVGYGQATVTAQSAYSAAGVATVNVVVPRAPNNFQIVPSSVTHNSVQLRWDASTEGVDRHHVYRRMPDGSSVRYGITWGRFATNITLQNLTPATAYQFYVIAGTMYGRSGSSWPVWFTTRLSPPENLRTTEIWTTRTTLRWDEVPGAWGYRIERNSGSGWVYAATTHNTTREITDLSGGRIHTFRVRAQFNSNAGDCRNSLWSSELRVLTRPHAPGNVRMTDNSTSSITIAWDASVGATSYVVYRNDNRVAENITGTSFTASGLAAGSSHTFRIRAANASGEGAQTSARTFSTVSAATGGSPQPGLPTAPIVPGTPALPAAPPILVTWPAPTRHIITSPFGFRQPNFVSFHGGIDVGTPIGEPIHTILNGTIANHNWALGGLSSVITHENGYVSRYLHLNQFLVSSGRQVWTGQLIARSGNTGNSTGPHLHFDIAPRTGGTRFNPLECYHPVDPRGRAFVRNGSIFNLTPAATPAGGASRGANSNPFFVLRDGLFVHNPNYQWRANFPTPNAPGNLRVDSFVNGTVTLRWNQSNTTTTGYHVYRSTGSAWFRVRTLSGRGTTEYSIAGPDPGATHWYAVRAFNGFGRVSPWSNPVTVAPVLGVRIDNPIFAINIDRHRNLTATAIHGDGTTASVTWQTSNQNIVSVDRYTGRMVANGSGRAIIMATSVANPTMWDSFTVDVIPNWTTRTINVGVYVDQTYLHAHGFASAGEETLTAACITRLTTKHNQATYPFRQRWELNIVPTFRLVNVPLSDCEHRSFHDIFNHINSNPNTGLRLQEVWMAAELCRIVGLECDLVGGLASSIGGTQQVSNLVLDWGEWWNWYVIRHEWSHVFGVPDVPGTAQSCFALHPHQPCVMPSGSYIRTDQPWLPLWRQPNVWCIRCTVSFDRRLH